MQAAAVEALLVMEEREKATDFTERFKLAVISADPRRWIREMFPAWFTTEAASTDAGQVPVAEDDDLSDTTGGWVFTEQITPEQALKELAEEGGLMVGGMVDLGENWVEA